MGKKKLAPKLQTWIEARKRFHMSHAQVQMARELGLNPKKFGGINNHRQESWKQPLLEFIEHLYLERFGKQRPDVVTSIEDGQRARDAKKAARRAERTAARLQGSQGENHGPAGH